MQIEISQSQVSDGDIIQNSTSQANKLIKNESFAQNISPSFTALIAHRSNNMPSDVDNLNRFVILSLLICQLFSKTRTKYLYILRL